MITSRKGSSGNSGILLPDSGKSSILRKTVRGQPGLSLTSKNSIELQFIAKHDKTPRPWLSPALTCSAKLWYYSKFDESIASILSHHSPNFFVALYSPIIL